jgi:hypothetical protein
MRAKLPIALIMALITGIIHPRANAVPSFARQTGLSCTVCHRNPPELTSFGRMFKLHGYRLSSVGPNERVGNSDDLRLSKYFPLSAMVLLSSTVLQLRQPETQNNTAGFPQQASIFLAGSFAPHFGGFTQVTYNHADDHFSMDNTDLRFANHATLLGTDNDFGVTLNNNPSVEDLWNSTPAWGFPWISSAAGVGPLASPVISGTLAQDVAGVGAYNMWNNHLYTAVTPYRSEHGGAPAPVSGTGSQFNISGVAPYWRAAWQQNWDQGYLEVGTYGIVVSSFPGAVSGTKDHYFDSAADFQYSRPVGVNQWDVHGTYIRENTDLDATYAAGGATAPHPHLNTWKMDTVFHWMSRYSVTAAGFSTTGTADPLLYAPAAVSGSYNGSPATSGYTVQFAYWPVQNLDLNVNYTGYRRFNGASTNYDGSNRNASDNNSLYMALWVSF